jgi:DNA-binding response OmpR family regulator
VLVVEDESGVRRYSTDALRELGYRVLEAGNAAEALELIDANQDIALLFTDVGLPGGINGRQLADLARAHRPELKVLFITGYAENAAIAAGFLEPGMEMITKPFATDAFGAKVRAMLRRD